MKKLLMLITGLLLVGNLLGQDQAADTAWKINGDVNVMFSQTSFSNWASGGENSLTMNGFFNFYAGYTKGKSLWENRLSLAYGQTKTGEQGYRKNEDKIDFLSTYGLKASEHWYYSANLGFKSQFTEGFDYHDDVDSLQPEKISNFMAPGYLTAGIGMEYKPLEYMSFYLSPVTARWIFVTDQELADAGAFGVEKAVYDDNGVKIQDGENIRQEFGAYFRFLFDKEIIKNVTFNTKLELFSDYLENPQNIDVNWDNMLGLKVNDWISAKVGLQIVYDDNTPITDKDGNTGPRTQIKQLLSVGLTYKFSN